MKETLDLCVSCKGCRRECPTGVDMAKMKIEFLHHYHARHGLPWKDRLIAYLPRYAPAAASGAVAQPARPDSGARQGDRALARARFTKRALPKWGRPWRDNARRRAAENVVGDGRDLVLFADTFNRYYERENLEAAERVLEGGGIPAAPCSAAKRAASALLRAHLPVRRSRRSGAAEARRTLDALSPFVAAAPASSGSSPPAF